MKKHTPREKEALEERDSFLENHPNLKEFQKEIDRLLQNAGSFENRMAVLGILMGAKLKDLQLQLCKLESITTGVLQ